MGIIAKNYTLSVGGNPTVWKTKSQQFGRQNPNSLEDKIPTGINDVTKNPKKYQNIWGNLGDIGTSKIKFFPKWKTWMLDKSDCVKIDKSSVKVELGGP